jgi:hypothetical protein
MSERFFSYDPDGDYFEFHETAEEAHAKAESALHTEAELATENGEWGERVREICWGEIKQIATEHKFGNGSDYVMEDVP